MMLSKKSLIISVVLLLVLPFSSCVSKRKFVQLQQQNAVLTQNNGECAKHNKELEELLESMAGEYKNHQKESEEEKKRLQEELELQNSKLSDKDQALQARAKRLRILEKQFGDQRAAVDLLKKTMSEALINFNTDELNVEVRNGKVYVSLSDKLLFPSASAELNKEGKDVIGKVAEVLAKNPEINIEIIGHTDNKPIRIKYPDNWDLSVARAVTITKLLTEKYGIDGKRLTASGKSKFSPVATNETDEGRSKNRRTEIVLTPKLDMLMQILEGKN